MQEYDVIGAGGFGTVVWLPDCSPDQVSKVILDTPRGNACEQAGREFRAHQLIYAQFQKAVAQDSSLSQRINVPQPLHFTNTPGQCTIFGLPPDADSDLRGCCKYSMERVVSSRADGLQQHIILNSDYRGHTGSLWCANPATTRQSADSTMSRQDRNTCRPRGEFAWHETLARQSGVPSLELAQRIGLLRRIVVEAGYAPKDVELVVDVRGVVAMYDFGMVGEEYRPFDVTLDMYVPLADEQPDLFAAYTLGFDRDLYRDSLAAL